MFDIEYKGANSVVINTKKVSLVFDPKLSLVGLEDLSIKGAVGLATEPKYSINSADARLTITGPGEYGVADADITGVATTHHLDSPDSYPTATIYTVAIGDVRIGVIGNVGTSFSDTLLEELGMLDVVILPVGGGGITLNAAEASTIVRSIGPKVVIPVHYADKSIKYEAQQDNLDVFVKALGAPLETTPKYKLKRSIELPPSLTIFELTRTS